MKSIFNVYRGAQLNCRQCAETILNKLIFNEKPLCMRVKSSETLASTEKKKKTEKKNKLEALSNGCRENGGSSGGFFPLSSCACDCFQKIKKK